MYIDENAITPNTMGFVGLVLAVSGSFADVIPSEFIREIPTIFKTLSSIAGLVLMLISIRYKVIQNRNKKTESISLKREVEENKLRGDKIDNLLDKLNKSSGVSEKETLKALADIQENQKKLKEIYDKRHNKSKKNDK